jgi:hypothetical protein
VCLVFVSARGVVRGGANGDLYGFLPAEAKGTTTDPTLAWTDVLSATRGSGARNQLVLLDLAVPAPGGATTGIDAERVLGPRSLWGEADKTRDLSALVLRDLEAQTRGSAQALVLRATPPGAARPNRGPLAAALGGALRGGAGWDAETGLVRWEYVLDVSTYGDSPVWAGELLRPVAIASDPRWRREQVVRSAKDLLPKHADLAARVYDGRIEARGHGRAEHPIDSDWVALFDALADKKTRPDAVAAQITERSAPFRVLDFQHPKAVCFALSPTKSCC